VALFLYRGFGSLFGGSAPKLADENNYLSRRSKMSSTGLAYYSRVAYPAERVHLFHDLATRVSVASSFVPR